MNVVLKINGKDYSAKLSTYQVENEITYSRVVTTLDNVEHPAPGFARPIVSVSFWPLTTEETAALYSDLSAFVVTVEYTDPYTGTVTTREMRIVSNLQAAFALRGIDGNCYYKGGAIRLRGV